MKKVLILMLVSFILLFGACSNENIEVAQENIENIENVSEAIEKVKDVAEDLGIEQETIDEAIEEVQNISKEEIGEVIEEVKEVAETLEEEVSKDLGVDIETSEDGTIVISGDDLEVNTDLGEDPGIDVWCITGEDFESENEYGSIEGTIIGPTTFKEEEYCQADAKADLGNGFEVDTTYYYNYGSSDVWIVTNIYGQEVEQHIVTE